MNRAYKVILSILRADFANVDAAQIVKELGEESFRLLEQHKLISYFVSKCKEDIIMQNEELKESWIANVRQHNVAKNTVLKLRSLLEKEGIRFAVIKGMALNHHIYGENQVRTFGDLDILVDHVNALRLNQVLNENGFYQKIGPTSATSLSGRNARAF